MLSSYYKKQTLGGSMAYKKIERDFSFADIAVQKFADKNRSMLFLHQINNTIDWQPVKDLLFKYYETGKAKEGERAYSRCFCLNACCFKNGFKLNPIPSWKAKSTIGSLLNLSLNCP